MGILEKFLKNNKFFLELDNDKETYKWPTKISEKTKSKQVEPDKVKSGKVEAGQVKTEKVISKDVGGQKTVNTNGADTATKVQSAPQVVNTSYSEEPSWIKGLYEQKEEEVVEVVVAEKTFAADSVVAKPRPNRRPGGSINKFRDLARELK